MGRRSPLVLWVLSAWLIAMPAWPQADPLALQQRAVARIDAVVDAGRRTGQRRFPAELAQAEQELVASNQALAARGDWPALANGLIKQGHTHRLQAQWGPAAALYKQAADAAQRGGHRVHHADALAWGALAESGRSNIGQALADAAQAVRIAEPSGDKDVLARALDVLATAQIAQRDLAGAADTANRGVAVAPEAKDSMAIYYALLTRSDVYLRSAARCDFQSTFDACHQALDLAGADLKQASDVARGRGFADLLRLTEDMGKGIEERRALIRLRERENTILQQARVFRPKKAGDVLVTERFVLVPSAPPPELVSLHEQVKREAQQAGGFADTSDATRRHTEGLMNEMQGRNDEALAHYLKAVETLERDRRSLRDERGRGSVLEDRIGIYYAALMQLLEQRRYAEAFELLERSRSRAMADLLASRELGLGRPDEQKLYAESVALRSGIAAAQGEMFELTASGDAARHGARLTALQGRIRALEADEQKLARRIAAEAPRLQGLGMSQPVTLAALQKSMRDERYEMLQYLVLPGGLVVWHIAPDAVTVRQVFLPRAQLAAKVGRLHQSLSRRDAAFDEVSARELFLFLVQPVLDRVRAERLVIVPHEDLGTIPFQALQDPADGRFLGERFQISYAPSASVLLGLRRSPGIVGGRLLAVASPGLDNARQEVQAIGRLFPGRGRVVGDTLARESEVKAWIGEADVIHLAVHGKFVAGEPLLSYLELGRDASDDGKLTAAEMFGLPLQSSRLVVLSACETGRAEATHGNEILGMVRALLYAGSATLVLSSWEVDSTATALWMQAFYEAAQTRPLVEAARNALLRVKARPEYNHPRHWAAFTLVGR